jgi:hypothetical protein
MVALFGQLLTARLKESSSMLFNRPIEEDNPCQVTADVVGMIKECHDSLVCFLKCILIFLRVLIFEKKRYMLVLEELAAVCPLLALLYKQQEQHVIAIADENKEIRGFSEVSKSRFRKREALDFV